jgi:hypothetical protein
LPQTPYKGKIVTNAQEFEVLSFRVIISFYELRVSTHSQTCADIDVGDADCIEGCPTSSWTSHMVRGTWLSNNHNIFYYDLPSPLLDYLRGARSPAPHTKTIVISMHIS